MPGPSSGDGPRPPAGVVPWRRFVPTPGSLAAYDDAGVTWVLVTGWLDDLRPLAATPPV